MTCERLLADQRKHFIDSDIQQNIVPSEIRHIKRLLNALVLFEVNKVVSKRIAETGILLAGSFRDRVLFAGSDAAREQ